MGSEESAELEALFLAPEKEVRYKVKIKYPGQRII
jgi:hypothetical protein